MGWASRYIDTLLKGETVLFRPRGGSMSPKIESGQLCTVEPVDPETVKVDDVVLCRVRGSEYLHRVLSVREEARGPSFLIGNNRGGTNGWTRSVFGRLTKVEP